MRRRPRTKLIWVRRLCNLVSETGPAAAMIILAFSGCNIGLGMTLLCLGYFLNGAISCGHMSSHIDLAPNFAGTLFGISNTLAGGVTGLVAPLVVGAITQDNMAFSAWRTVYFVAAAIYLLGTSVYFVLIKVEVQTWNYPSAASRKIAIEGEEDETNEEKDAEMELK